MRALLFLLLVPSAWAADIDLQALNTRINATVTYAHYYGWDFRDVSAGGTGNCVAIAYTKWKILDRAGYGKRIALRSCALSSGEGHTFVVVDGRWALDNRWPYFYQASSDDCQGQRIDLNITSLREWVAIHPDHRPLSQMATRALSGSGQ